MYDQYFGNFSTQVDCDTYEEYLPELAFYIGGKPYVMKPKDYVIRLHEDSYYGETCMLGIQAFDIGGIDIILGDMFMQTYFVYHDGSNGRIGLAVSNYDIDRNSLLFRFTCVAIFFAVYLF